MDHSGQRDEFVVETHRVKRAPNAKQVARGLPHVPRRD